MDQAEAICTVCSEVSTFRTDLDELGDRNRTWWMPLPTTWPARPDTVPRDAIEIEDVLLAGTVDGSQTCPNCVKSPRFIAGSWGSHQSRPARPAIGPCVSFGE